MDARGLGDTLDVLIGGFGCAIGDVVTNGRREQKDVLLDGADDLSQRGEGASAPGLAS